MDGAKTVLIVEDDPLERRLLYHSLSDRYRTLEAGDKAGALTALEREHVDIVLLDLHLPPSIETTAEGFSIQESISRRDPNLPLVVITGDQDHHVALDMIDRGVADFLLKPIDPLALNVVIARVLDRAALQRELQELRRTLRERCALGHLIGQSRIMRALFATLLRLAASSANVLLLGESGTGKSAAARALHEESPRAEGPFVVVDGAAIPESLMESELFGHVRGAYTGATGSRAGRIQMAHGGTLFLDEIGNLSPVAQSKLLLFLDRRSYTPVGSTAEVKVDVRLVAATNLDVQQLVADGRFRADLLYRIQVATAILPPLRERSEDISLLADFLLASLGKEIGRPHVRLSADAIGLLESYHWPGNVRQLKHVLEGSLVLLDGDLLRASDLILPGPAAAVSGAPTAPPPAPAMVELPSGAEPETADFREQVGSYERNLIGQALLRSGGNKAAAGRLLGLDENQIRYLCRKHGIA
jgi:DNA-binding NtrC family response regulator